jgi:hypothetical protein
MGKRKPIAAMLAVAITAGLVIGPAALTSAHTTKTKGSNVKRLPVHGHVEGTGKKFWGTMKVKKFKTNDAGDKLKVVGEVSGRLVNSNGKVLKRIEGRRVVAPVQNMSVDGESTGTFDASASAATCNILRLTLGPLDLDLLGLVVHLNRVVLVIDAESGPGNLLGNLLCAIAGLLDGGLNLDAVLGSIADILNAILGILRL